MGTNASVSAGEGESAMVSTEAPAANAGLKDGATASFSSASTASLGSEEKALACQRVSRKNNEEQKTMRLLCNDSFRCHFYFILCDIRGEKPSPSVFKKRKKNLCNADFRSLFCFTGLGGESLSSRCFYKQKKNKAIVEIRTVTLVFSLRLH